LGDLAHSFQSPRESLPKFPGAYERGCLLESPVRPTLGGVTRVGHTLAVQPISEAPRNGTLIRFWCRSEQEPIVGYWSGQRQGWVSYAETVPLVRHDVLGWEPVDKVQARALRL
jgi:hypothetical protein